MKLTKYQRAILQRAATGDVLISRSNFRGGYFWDKYTPGKSPRADVVQALHRDGMLKQEYRFRLEISEKGRRVLEDKP